MTDKAFSAHPLRRSFGFDRARTGTLREEQVWIGVAARAVQPPGSGVIRGIEHGHHGGTGPAGRASVTVTWICW